MPLTQCCQLPGQVGFSPWESQNVHTHCQKCHTYFYGFVNPGHWHPKLNLWDTGTELCKTHKTGTLLGKSGRMDPLPKNFASFMTHAHSFLLFALCLHLFIFSTPKSLSTSSATSVWAFSLLFYILAYFKTSS
jgi:hypothetical protein